MPVITRPGDGERRDAVLDQAYVDQDNAIAGRMMRIIDELNAFANANMSVQVYGFDASRYLPLKRDARQVMSELHRSLQRWQQTVS